MFGFLTKKELLEEASILWMFDCYAWFLKHFDADYFYQQTLLVTPSNEHFPGRENSAHGMANLIFEKVKNYSGLTHWPTVLLNQHQYEQLPAQSQLPELTTRNNNALLNPEPPSSAPRLPIVYNEFALNNPEVLIANYAHTMAHHLGSTAREVPPGGMENWPHVTELLAVYLGFGVIMANTAFTSRSRSCASCAGPIVERTNFLSQYDMTYALAIFAHLKQIPTSEVFKGLKSSLKPFFKKSLKDVERRMAAYPMLQVSNS